MCGVLFWVVVWQLCVSVHGLVVPTITTTITFYYHYCSCCYYIQTLAAGCRRLCKAPLTALHTSVVARRLLTHRVYTDGGYLERPPS